MNPHLTDYLQSGIALILATRDASMEPHGVRCYGLVVHENPSVITVFTPESTISKALENLKAFPDFSLVAGRPTDYVSVQLKGTFISTRKADNRDRLIINRYNELFWDQVRKIGGKYPMYDEQITWPAVALDLSVSEVFNQTPGKNAGDKLYEIE